MTTADEVRVQEQVVEDGLWPGVELGGPDHRGSRRHSAIATVLGRIPEDDYRKLKEAARSFTWFIPLYEEYGMVYPFPVTHPGEESKTGQTESACARVLYLSPRLEEAAWDIVVAVVAHELAHIAVCHELFPDGAQDQTQEDIVFQRVCEWGFQREAEKHRALNKRRGRTNYPGRRG